MVRNSREAEKIEITVSSEQGKNHVHNRAKKLLPQEGGGTNTAQGINHECNLETNLTSIRKPLL